MARINQVARTGRRIAVVDDDADLQASTTALLVRDGHEVRGAESPAKAIELIREWHPDLVLLDYYLEGGTGADVVRVLREDDHVTQVLLVTGYAAEQPGRKLMRELDIQGYHNKADGADRLLILVDGALAHYRALARFVRQQDYLERVLQSAPDISRLQPPQELFQRALAQLRHILKGGDGLIATSNNGLFVLGGIGSAVTIHAGSGKYEEVRSLPELPPVVASVVMEALKADSPIHHGAGFLAVPLRTRDGDKGCMLLECSEMPPDAHHACMLYAQQVIQSLENVLLYERATVDNLTRLANRAHGLQRLHETLKLASRAARPTSVVMVDVDHFKIVNDTLGHAAGDFVLRRLGAALRQIGRESDIASRHGGEELLLVLPDTDRDGAEIVAERTRRMIEELEIVFDGTRIPLTASLDVATADTSTVSVDELLAAADRALYTAKDAGRNRVRVAGGTRDSGLRPLCAG
jgi:diguanylate cyclase (GGDEF)-like protein